MLLLLLIVIILTVKELANANSIKNPEFDLSSRWTFFTFMKFLARNAGLIEVESKNTNTRLYL